MVLGPCIKQLAATVRRNVKFLLCLKKAGQCIVETVLQSVESSRSES